MSSTEPILAPMAEPYCKGCGHTLIVRALATALERLPVGRDQICLTSDIGCVGLIDRLFPTIHTVHTTHGRSTAFATGTTIADGVLYDGRLKNVVVIGDGGANIGLLHLVAAAQLNVDLTVVLHNNHLFGMTGGQASGMSPLDWTTPTTLSGNPLPPLEMIGLLRAAGASYLSRELASDPRLPDRLEEAISHPGFALVEVLEICTAFGTRYNKLSGPRLRQLAEETGEPLGLREHVAGRPPFRRAWREHHEERPVEQKAMDLPDDIAHGLRAPLRLVVAGTAGERVQSAVATVARCAVAAGLYATQKSENLVTQGTGFSLSELVISPDPIHYTGIDHPDALIAVSAEGLSKLRVSGRLERLAPDGILLADDTLEGLPDQDERLRAMPLRKAAGGASAAMAALALVCAWRDVFAPPVLAEAAERTWGSKGRRTVKAIRWAEDRLEEAAETA